MFMRGLETLLYDLSRLFLTPMTTFLQVIASSPFILQLQIAIMHAICRSDLVYLILAHISMFR